MLRQLKAHDLEAEALYYLGELSEAQSIYAKALEIAEAAATRWPSDSRMRWALLRQQWNLGSTLVTAGRPQDAVPLLTGALAGWQALQATDPSDEAVAAWIRATRLSVGQALEASGQRPAAIPVLSDAVAERRVWLADKPGDPDRRRMLMKGLATLGDALASLQRVAEACSLYAEARTLVDTMARDRQLTGFDRSETVRLLAASETRFCASAP
ncbi:MAG: tetratricopeptide repeat protein [Thermaurantiacus sp.]